MKPVLPYIEILDLLKKQRQKLVDDTIELCSPEIYGGLLSDPSSEIANVYFELYEIECLKLTWQHIIHILDNKQISNNYKKDIISSLSRMYQEFIDSFININTDMCALEERRQILKQIISINDDWEKSIRQMEVSFNRSIKILRDTMQKMKEA